MNHAIWEGRDGGNFDERHAIISVHPLYELFLTLLQPECLELWVLVFGRYPHLGKAWGRGPRNYSDLTQRKRGCVYLTAFLLFPDLQDWLIYLLCTRGLDGG